MPGAFEEALPGARPHNFVAQADLEILERAKSLVPVSENVYDGRLDVACDTDFAYASRREMNPSELSLSGRGLPRYVPKPRTSSRRLICGAVAAVVLCALISYRSYSVNGVPPDSVQATVLKTLGIKIPHTVSRRELASGTSAPTVSASPTITAAPSATITSAPTQIPARTLTEAAKIGSVSAAQTYLNAGTDINSQDEDGSTPLVAAAWHGNLEMVKFLISRGADVEWADKSGLTPLHVAAKQGYEKVLEKLLSKDPDVNIKNHKRESPLHIAAHFQQLETAEVLLKQRHIKVNAHNEHGRTPLDMCKDTIKGESIKKLLRKYGGKTAEEEEVEDES